MTPKINELSAIIHEIVVFNPIDNITYTVGADYDDEPFITFEHRHLGPRL